MHRVVSFSIDVVFCLLVTWCDSTYCSRSVLLCVFFFFQAEDGIRDLVRSRGLGDVYKRQGLQLLLFGKGALLAGQRDVEFEAIHEVHLKPRGAQSRGSFRRPARPTTPVSYTHLTLPTSDLV